MPEAPAHLFGCLPVIVKITGGKDADTPNGPGEYWTEIEEIWWRKRDGSKGKPVSEKLFRLASEDYNLEEEAWNYIRRAKESEVAPL